MATYQDHYEVAKQMTRVQLETAVMRDKAKNHYGYSARLDAYQTALREKIAVELAASKLAATL